MSEKSILEKVFEEFKKLAINGPSPIFTIKGKPINFGIVDELHEYPKEVGGPVTFPSEQAPLPKETKPFPDVEFTILKMNSNQNLIPFNSVSSVSVASYQNDPLPANSVKKMSKLQPFAEPFLNKPVAATQEAAPVGKTAVVSKPGLKKKAKATKKAPKKPLAAVVFQWRFVSSQQSLGGQKAVYSTLLRQDKTLTCNCPGWIFKKSGAEGRWCKHTKQIEDESVVIFKKWKNGEELPKIDDSEDLNTSQALPSIGKKNDSAYGRTIEI